MLRFSPQTQDRARRAWRCSPFRWLLFKDLQERGVPLAQIWGKRGYQAGYTVRPLSEDQADQELMWLIQVGVLRREVDGQGITDSYRLAPLGRQLLEQLDPDASSQPSFADRLQNQLSQWGIRS